MDIAAALTKLGFGSSGPGFEPSIVDQEHLRNLAASVASIRGDLMSRRIPASIPVNIEEGTASYAVAARDGKYNRAHPSSVCWFPIHCRISTTLQETTATPKLIAADAFVQPGAPQVRAQRVLCGERLLRHL